jgi:hypothetical protein
MEWLKDTFGTRMPIIGMLHLQLPSGEPQKDRKRHLPVLFFQIAAGFDFIVEN